jgi:hypothetical protein
VGQVVKFVIQHVPGVREDIVGRLLDVLPDALVVACQGDAMGTFLHSLVADAHWHLEDDVCLCPGFVRRTKVIVREHGEGIIRGFATNNLAGPMPGSSYLYNQCTYFPEGYGPAIVEFAKSWSRRSEHPTGFDLLIRDWLVTRREKYWLASPSLVQHLVVPSLLGPRSKFRRSPTWDKAYGGA